MELSKIKYNNPKKWNAKGQSGGLVSGIIVGVVGLVLTLIVAYLFITTLTGNNLLTANSAESNATTRLVANFTSGVDSVSSKIPTLFVVAAIVLILGVLAILVAVWQRMKFGGGNGGGL